MGGGEIAPALGNWGMAWPRRGWGHPPRKWGNAAQMWEMHGKLLLILNLRREDYEDECR